MPAHVNKPIKFHIVLMSLGCMLSSPLSADGIYYTWQQTEDAIEQPLNGLTGNATRGRRLAADRDKGNCLSCHQLPIAEEPFHGNVGPDLHGIASRLTAGQIRLRVVDEKVLNPLTIMPGYYRHPDTLRLVANEFAGKTLLTAQEIEDIVAYLVTLK